MTQKPGNLTNDWFDKQVHLYEKSIAELMGLALLKPCIS